MAAGYFQAAKTRDRATFELYVRRLPPNRTFLLAVGLAQAVEYLLNLRFTAEEIAYLRTLPQFAHTPEGFFEMLAGLRFTGDLFAVPEGTPMFPDEPFLTVRAPLVEAQLVETFLLSTIGFQSMIATKAAVVVSAAQGRPVVEFGTRRAHSPEAGVLAGRAAYIGGCVGTSNAETGFHYGVPVFGTSAHSWVMSFPDELAAFRQLQQLLGEHTVQLIDTYDTLEGARRAASLGRPLWGVRLDSGNLAELAPAVRRILDDAGLREAKIMATGDLKTSRRSTRCWLPKFLSTYSASARKLSTSADAPFLGVVYKLVELESAEGVRHPVKLSFDKHTLPGAKQVFRYADHDVLARASECPSCPDGSGACQALQRPVIVGGALVEPLPSAADARKRATDSQPLPANWRVELSAELAALDDNIRKGTVL